MLGDTMKHMTMKAFRRKRGIKTLIAFIPVAVCLYFYNSLLGRAVYGEAGDSATEWIKGAAEGDKHLSRGSPYTPKQPRTKLQAGDPF
jgi:hypothetical protein